jgi:hypothetical protein
MTAYSRRHALITLMLGAAVACAVALAGCGGATSGSKSGTPAKESGSKSATASAAGSATTGSAGSAAASATGGAAVPASGAGAELTSGTWKMSVAQAGPAAGSEGISLLPGDDLIIVDGKVTNGASTPQPVESTSFTMRDGLGTMYSIIKTKSPDCVYNMTQPIAPGGSAGIRLMFEVPKAVKSLRLEYAPRVEGAPAQSVFLTVR